MPEITKPAMPLLHHFRIFFYVMNYIARLFICYLYHTDMPRSILYHTYIAPKIYLKSHGLLDMQVSVCLQLQG